MQPLASPEQVAADLRDIPGSIWLDGGDATWSVLAWDPADVVRESDAWVEAGRARTRVVSGHEGLPFVGGCLGYVGYGAGHAVAPVPRWGPTWEPDVWLGRYEGALLFHGPTRTWVAVGPSRFRTDAARRVAAARELPAPAAPTGVPLPGWTRDAYEAAVRSTQDLIRDGDVYQLNVTRVAHARQVGDAFDAMRRLRSTSRPERGAWLVLDHGVRVASNSPERLLDVDQRVASTTPIKGTRPRDADPALDAAATRELMSSAKERAELTMIVDLCRNDLGRVAVPGTVTVGPRTPTAHTNVHHASQTVRATLRPGVDAWDALAAVFPPGSVTGAPKIRACQRIAELEPEPRGVYCGAIGFVSDHGRASWSVAIRTAVFRGDEARWHIGSGIVADSDPAAEWEETVAKGTLLAAAILAP